MMTPCLVLLALATTPIKVAVTRLNVVDLSDSRGEFYTEHLAGRLADEGLEVTTQREIAALLGLERQRQIVGCAEEGACLAEIAAALGVDGIALGDVARVGTGFQLNVKIVSAKTGKRLAAFSTLAKSEDELVTQMGQASQVMARKLSEALGQPLPAAAVGRISTTASSGGIRRWWWVPALIGAGAGAGGAIGLANAESGRVRLSTEQLEQGQAQQILESGKTARALGFVGVGVGVAALGTALGFLIFGDEAPVVPSASLQGGNPTVVLSGAFP